MISTPPPQDANEAGADLTIPTTDPAANLHPTKPKDFTAFINLVEFCRYDIYSVYFKEASNRVVNYTVF